MSASFYDLMKYAHTGLATADMTAFDKLRAQEMAGGKVKTLTGVPPLIFKSNGKPLISWSMLGNGQQNGTPAPDNPIMPTFCGERTENFFNIVAFAENSYESTATIARNGNTIILTATSTDAYINQVIIYRNTTPEQYQPSCISVEPETEYTIYLSKAPKCYISWLNDSFLAVDNFTRIPLSFAPTSYTFTTPAGCTKILLRIGQETTIGKTIQFSDIMLVKGSTAPSSYIPYGWKIPVTSAGQTTPIYLGQTQTTRRVKKLVLDGTENWVMSAAWEKPNTVVYFFELAGINTAGGTSTAWIYSDRFPAKSRDDLYNADYNCIARTGSIAITVRVNKSTAPTRDDFKAWLSQQSAAGAPVTIWYILANKETAIVNEPLCKIGDYSDTLDSADAGITIPTAKGANTLTVDTELQPSSMTIKYR